MIQRLQSLYLIMTTLLPLLFLKGRILKFGSKEGSEFVIGLRGFHQVTGENDLEILQGMLPLSLVIISIPLLSLLAIFLFRKRKIQLRITLVLIIMTILLIALTIYYWLLVIKNYQLSLMPVFEMFIPFLVLLFSLLAYRSIKKDEEIVRSYDRLR